jgi:hypothetical protein
MRVLLRLLLALTLAAGAIFSAAPVEAQGSGAAALIKKGEDMFEEQRYEESIQTLSAVVARKDIPRAQRVRALQLMAYNHIVLGNLDQARGVVWSIYAEDEDFVIGEAESPRFREFFETSKAEWIEAGRPGKAVTATTVRVKIKHSPPSQGEPGAAISLRGVVEDPDAQVSRLQIFYRAGSSGKFTSRSVKFAMRRFSVSIPASIVEPPLVEYYLQAVDKQGVPVASRGDAEAPLRISIQEETSVLESPWFWLPVSVAVVAAVVIPVVVVTTSTSESTVSVNVFER